MNKDSVSPYKGPSLIDVQDIAGSLVDLPPKAMQPLTREKEEFGKLKEEWATAMAGPLGPEVIPPPLYQRFVDKTALLQKVRQRLGEAEKLAEVLRETQALIEDEREGDIAMVAKAVKAAIQHKGDAFEAAFENTLNYYSQIADKAVATRRKNADAGQAEEAAGAKAGDKNG